MKGRKKAFFNLQMIVYMENIRKICMQTISSVAGYKITKKINHASVP